MPACLAASSNPSPNSSLSTPEVLELGQRPHRRLLVEPLDRETDVHDDVLADLGVGMYCRQTSLRTPPKSTTDISVPSRSSMLTDPPRYRQTHGVLPS